MKIKYILVGLLSTLTVLSSCIDEETNRDPNAINDRDAKPEWALNRSIGNAQQDPHLAERIFVLTWKRASRFDRGSGFTLGADNNGWMTDYLSAEDTWGVSWLRDASTAINIAQARIESGDAVGDNAYYKNVQQMARIWRAYLNSEFADGFGPIPALNAFQGVTPDYNSVEDVYKFMLDELKDAEAKLDVGIKMDAMDAKTDPFYGGFKADVRVQKWKQLANSLRMRLAMRLSKVAPDLAKQHFEDAVGKGYIATLDDVARVAEYDAWSPFAGVMSRPWNSQPVSTTFSNLVVGLGGQEYIVPDSLKGQLKDPYTYLGMKLDKHFALKTNDPAAGYFFNGIPKYIDPRATILYSITGYKDDQGIYPENFAPESHRDPKKLKIKLLADSANNIPEVEINLRHTWSTVVAGEWGDIKTKVSQNYIGGDLPYLFPSISNAYRMSQNKRVFFGNWESYFLLAEAKHYGWNVPGTVQQHYENGIKASFEYLGLSSRVANYLTSTAYNRVGTSVAFTHTAEAASFTINYVDGYTKQNMTTTYKYPKNSIHNGGATNNDVLTKIITQKYIAQMPWLPLEAWSDHRRLGLPFFENQAVEKAYDAQTQVPLTPEKSMVTAWEFYPQRYRYPANFQVNNSKGYQQALQYLGGADKSITPLWWSGAANQ